MRFLKHFPQGLRGIVVTEQHLTRNQFIQLILVKP